jgi:soluble lytic murein transglycosylase-like protein
MRSCFGIFGAYLGTAALLGAAGLPDSKTVTSVIRRDSRSGRLVRTMVVPKQAEGARKSPSPSEEDIRDLVEETAKLHGVDPLLVHSMIAVESGYNPFAISYKGAEGLMQLIPSTARRFGVQNSFDSRDNISGGVRYLRHLLDLFQDKRLAVAAYNAGEHAVQRYGGVPPYKETQNYVRLVGSKYDAARRVAARPQAAEPVEQAEAAGDTYAPLELRVDERGNWYLRTR